MKHYRSNVPITLRSGVVVLTEEQFSRRTSELKPGKGKDQYEIVGEARFKAGEEFGYDGDIPKIMAGDMKEIDASAKHVEIETRHKSKA